MKNLIDIEGRLWRIEIDDQSTVTHAESVPLEWESLRLLSCKGDTNHPTDDETDAVFELYTPGLVDLQVNDMTFFANPQQFCTDSEENEFCIEKILVHLRKIEAFQRSKGCLRYLLATLAAPLRAIEAYVEAVRVHMNESMACLGLLIEGTFMNPTFHGCHNPADIDCDFTRGAFDGHPIIKLCNMKTYEGTNVIRIVNVMLDYTRGERGELSPRWKRIYASLQSLSLSPLISVGHDGPTAETVAEAVHCGLQYTLHLGNGPTGSSTKTFCGGGLLQESLRNDEIAVGIIGDGVHVHPEIVRDWYSRKPPAKVVIVSDVAYGEREIDIGERFVVNGVCGMCTERGALRYLQVVPPDTPSDTPLDTPLDTPSGTPLSTPPTLFGSASAIDAVFVRVLDLLHTPSRGVYVPFHPSATPRFLGPWRDAVRMCCCNPLRTLAPATKQRGEKGVPDTSHSVSQAHPQACQRGEKGVSDTSQVHEKGWRRGVEGVDARREGSYGVVPAVGEALRDFVRWRVSIRNGGEMHVQLEDVS